MKVAIIGAGFTGLAAGVELVDAGAEVTIYEADKKPGGLAVGFSVSGWDWSLERYYHHIFANDRGIINLAKKVGWPAFFTTPKTNSFINGKEAQLDSPLSLLKFGQISLFSRLRMGVGLLILKLIQNGTFLEKYTVASLLPKLVGRDGYVKIWQPLLIAKFGPYLPKVNMAWFWARVYKRTQALGYFKGGFSELANKTVDYIQARGGVVLMGKKLDRVSQRKDGKWQVEDKIYDKILITLPAPLVNRLLGREIVASPKIEYLSAQTLVLELTQSLMKGYWLNILEKDFPFMVVVEHTNLIDKKHYGGKRVIYLGNYLPNDDRRLALSEEKLLGLYLPFLSRINKDFSAKWLSRSWCFETPFAQPVFPVNYSRVISKMTTKLNGLYVANMSMVYPWDRGTNYAVILGQKAAKLLKDA